MAGTIPAALVWLVIVAAGVGTFALRASFVVLFRRVEAVPPRVEGALRYVPPAVLTALVVPAVVVVDGSIAVTPGNERLLAAAVAALVAWRTERVLPTLGVGMAALWGLRFLT